MTNGVRRIVTGHDGNGRAIVARDTVLAASERADAQVRFFKVWTTDRSPADNMDPGDAAERESGLTLAGGSVIRVTDLAPGMRSPMHRTSSVDYGIVLQGEIDLELDDGSVTSVHAGEIVVQRGTIHAWVNNTSEWCRIAFVLIEAMPVTVAGQRLQPTGH
jgi:quercetin dioxygenase-like cupin family protein